jgi:hypothetical protein
LAHSHPIAELLTSDILGPETLKGWFDSNWWLSAMPQAHVKFRESLGEVTLFLTLDEGFVEKDKWGGYEPKMQFYGIESDEFNHFDRLWITRNQLLSNQPFNVSGPRISLVSNSAITLCSKFENSQAQYWHHEIQL